MGAKSGAVLQKIQIFAFGNKKRIANLYDKESVTLEMQRPKQAPMTC